MQKLRNVLLVCASALLFSCAKSPFSNGETATRLDTVDSVRVVMVYDNIDVVLRHADADHIAGSYQITTGENLIDKIKVEHPVHKINGKDIISYDTVTIRNYNTLNWMRPYDYELKLTLFYDSISEIVFNSNGKLETDIMKGVSKPDEHEDDIWGFGDREMKLTITGGSGDVNLKTDCFQLVTKYEFGTAKVFIEGKSSIATTYCSYNSHGPVNATNLWSNYHYIFHYGTNYINAFAKHEISAGNYNNGEIYYVVSADGSVPEVLDTIGPRIHPFMP